jgi:DtxR family Mn-dependent transcriptional regulator
VVRRAPTDLSSAAQEYLLALRIAAGDGCRVTTAHLARKVGVTTQAASEMVRRLAADGLVAQGDGRELLLTPAGRAAADAIFRRHALLEWLLTSVVGLGWAESDIEAARLQGAISPRVEAALDALMGHPETCPHGNPIDHAAAERRPVGIPLGQMEAGERATIYRITEDAEEDPALLSYLEARALTPGAHVTILARSESLGALTLEGPIGRATLGLRPAGLVHVLRGEADPALFHRVPANVRRA